MSDVFDDLPPEPEYEQEEVQSQAPPPGPVGIQQVHGVRQPVIPQYFEGFVPFAASPAAIPQVVLQLGPQYRNLIVFNAPNPIAQQPPGQLLFSFADRSTLSGNLDVGDIVEFRDIMFSRDEFLFLVSGNTVTTGQCFVKLWYW